MAERLGPTEDGHVRCEEDEGNVLIVRSNGGETVESVVTSVGSIAECSDEVAEE